MEIEEHAVFSGRQAALLDLRGCFKEALDRLLRSIEQETLTVFETLFNSQLDVYRRAANNDVPPSSGYIHTGTDSKGASGDAKGLKRRHGDDDKYFYDDRQDSNPNKKQRFDGGLSTTSRKMWACPYYKREPHRYCVVTELGDFRKCAKSPGFSEVHRVKLVLQTTHFWSVLTGLQGSPQKMPLPKVLRQVLRRLQKRRRPYNSSENVASL
jgi:hypothetical protein